MSEEVIFEGRGLRYGGSVCFKEGGGEDARRVRTRSPVIEALRVSCASLWLSISAVSCLSMMADWSSDVSISLHIDTDRIQVKFLAYRLNEVHAYLGATLQC